MLNLELLIIREDSRHGIFVCLKPKLPALITPSLVENIRGFQDSLAEKILANSDNNFLYVIWYLENFTRPCCQGLDYNFIVDCLKNKGENEFEHYISRVFNLMFLNHIGLGLPIINCSIINQNVSGLSNEFFLLNRICFVEDVTSEGIKSLNIHEKFPKLLFDNEIYHINSYYTYKTLETDKIRALIENINYTIPSVEEIESIRRKFDTLKEETITTIYDLAAKNIRVLERLARICCKQS